MIHGTTSGRIVIVGAGGFGREVLDIVEAINAAGGTLEFVGFVDDGDVDHELLSRRNAKLLGPTSALADIDVAYVIAVGNGKVRASLDATLKAAGGFTASLVHPSSSAGADNRIEAGAVITAGTRITTNIGIGRHVHLNLNSTIGHDTEIGDYVSVFPGATISGNVTIGNRVTVGTGANILPGVTIGDRAFVGAGAVVTRDVPSDTTVVGSPARPLK